MNNEVKAKLFDEWSEEYLYKIMILGDIEIDPMYKYYIPYIKAKHRLSQSIHVIPWDVVDYVAD